MRGATDLPYFRF